MFILIESCIKKDRYHKVIDKRAYYKKSSYFIGQLGFSKMFDRVKAMPPS